MYDIRKETRKFEMGDPESVKELNIIENNPLCSVTHKQFITTEKKEFSNGKISNTYQEIVCILEWNEKVLVE